MSGARHRRKDDTTRQLASERQDKLRYGSFREPDDLTQQAAVPPTRILPVSPRGLSRTQAAAYVGVSPSLFDAMVKDGRMPQPKRINTRTIWDRTRIDEAFEALPGGDISNPWDNAAA